MLKYDRAVFNNENYALIIITATAQAGGVTALCRFQRESDDKSRRVRRQVIGLTFQYGRISGVSRIFPREGERAEGAYNYRSTVFIVFTVT